MDNAQFKIHILLYLLTLSILLMNNLIPGTGSDVMKHPSMNATHTFCL